MKVLPCRVCHLPALATREREGGLLLLAGSMADRVMTYICRRCGRPNRVTSMEFAQLPEATPEQVRASDLKDVQPPS